MFLPRLAVITNWLSAPKTEQIKPDVPPAETPQAKSTFQILYVVCDGLPLGFMTLPKYFTIQEECVARIKQYQETFPTNVYRIQETCPDGTKILRYASGSKMYPDLSHYGVLANYNPQSFSTKDIQQYVKPCFILTYSESMDLASAIMKAYAIRGIWIVADTLEYAIAQTPDDRYQRCSVDVVGNAMTITNLDYKPPQTTAEPVVKTEPQEEPSAEYFVVWWSSTRSKFERFNNEPYKTQDECMEVLRTRQATCPSCVYRMLIKNADGTETLRRADGIHNVVGPYYAVVCTGDKHRLTIDVTKMKGHVLDYTEATDLVWRLFKKNPVRGIWIINHDNTLVTAPGPDGQISSHCRFEKRLGNYMSFLNPAYEPPKVELPKPAADEYSVLCLREGDNKFRPLDDKTYGTKQECLQVIKEQQELHYAQVFRACCRNAIGEMQLFRADGSYPATVADYVVFRNMTKEKIYIAADVMPFLDVHEAEDLGDRLRNRDPHLAVWHLHTPSGYMISYNDDGQTIRCVPSDEVPFEPSSKLKCFINPAFTAPRSAQPAPLELYITSADADRPYDRFKQPKEGKPFRSWDEIKVEISRLQDLSPSSVFRIECHDQKQQTITRHTPDGRPLVQTSDEPSFVVLVNSSTTGCIITCEGISKRFTLTRPEAVDLATRFKQQEGNRSSGFGAWIVSTDFTTAYFLDAQDNLVRCKITTHDGQVALSLPAAPKAEEPSKAEEPPKPIKEETKPDLELFITYADGDNLAAGFRRYVSGPFTGWTENSFSGWGEEINDAIRHLRDARPTWVFRVERVDNKHNTISAYLPDGQIVAQSSDRLYFAVVLTPACLTNAICSPDYIKSRGILTYLEAVELAVKFKKANPTWGVWIIDTGHISGYYINEQGGMPHCYITSTDKRVKLSVVKPIAQTTIETKTTYWIVEANFYDTAFQKWAGPYCNRAQCLARIQATDGIYPSKVFRMLACLPDGNKTETYLANGTTFQNSSPTYAVTTNTDKQRLVVDTNKIPFIFTLDEAQDLARRVAKQEPNLGVWVLNKDDVKYALGIDDEGQLTVRTHVSYLGGLTTYADSQIRFRVVLWNTSSVAREVPRIKQSLAKCIQECEKADRQVHPVVRIAEYDTNDNLVQYFTPTGGVLPKESCNWVSFWALRDYKPVLSPNTLFPFYLLTYQEAQQMAKWQVKDNTTTSYLIQVVLENDKITGIKSCQTMDDKRCRMTHHKGTYRIHKIVNEYREHYHLRSSEKMTAGCDSASSLPGFVGQRNGHMGTWARRISHYNGKTTKYYTNTGEYISPDDLQYRVVDSVDQLMMNKDFDLMTRQEAELEVKLHDTYRLVFWKDGSAQKIEDANGKEYELITKDEKTYFQEKANPPQYEVMFFSDEVGNAYFRGTLEQCIKNCGHERRILLRDKDGAIIERRDPKGELIDLAESHWTFLAGRLPVRWLKNHNYIPALRTYDEIVSHADIDRFVIVQIVDGTPVLAELKDQKLTIADKGDHWLIDKEPEHSFRVTMFNGVWTTSVSIHNDFASAKSKAQELFKSQKLPVRIQQNSQSQCLASYDHDGNPVTDISWHTLWIYGDRFATNHGYASSPQLTKQEAIEYAKQATSTNKNKLLLFQYDAVTNTVPCAEELDGTRWSASAENSNWIFTKQPTPANGIQIIE